MAKQKKYSLWVYEHESIYIVTAHKVKDTNSDKEVDRWVEEDPFYHAASLYRECNEINAAYLNPFQNY